MTNLTVTLGAGLLLLILLFLLLNRWTPLNGKQSALVAGLLTCTAYLPFPLLRWPGADVVTIHFAIYLVCAYVLGIIASHRDTLRREDGSLPPGKWFHWGPAAIVIFFVVIIAVDTVFVTLAVNGVPKGIEKELLPARLAVKAANTEFPGVVHDHYYQKETAFNDYLQQVAAQRKRGWKVRKGWLTQTPSVGQAEVFQVRVTDRDGQPIGDAKVSGRFVRPSDSRFDQRFSMAQVGDGLYRVTVMLPQPGVWELQLLIRQGTLTHRLTATTNIAALATGVHD